MTGIGRDGGVGVGEGSEGDQGGGCEGGVGVGGEMEGGGGAIGDAEEDEGLEGGGPTDGIRELRRVVV